MEQRPDRMTNSRATRWLRDPRLEHDACGVGFVVDVKGQTSHRIVEQGLEVLRNLTHRGACGCDPLTGDGAGILVQVPDAFLRREAKSQRIALPAEGAYGVGMVFLPSEVRQRNECQKLLEKVIRQEGQKVLGWRRVPVDVQAPGPQARARARTRTPSSASSTSSASASSSSCGRRACTIPSASTCRASPPAPSST